MVAIVKDEYKPRYGIGWLEDIFYNDETTYKIKRLFEVSDTDFCSEEPYLPNDDVCYFVLGELKEDGCYHIFNHILNTDYDILISEKAQITLNYFGISQDYPAFKKQSQHYKVEKLV